MCLDGWVRETESSGSWVILFERGAWSDCTKAFAWRFPRKEKRIRVTKFTPLAP